MALSKRVDSFQHWATTSRDFKAEKNLRKTKVEFEKRSFSFSFFISNLQNKYFFLQREEEMKGRMGTGGCWFFSVFFAIFLFSLFFNRCKNDWNPSRPHYHGSPESRHRGLRSSSNDWNMICIKANNLPRQSIKLARTSGEERKRYHQSVIVSDAWSPG